MSDIIKRKPNVLWVSEASFLNTGFSTLSKGIMERIFPTFKYHLYEYGSYAKTSDSRKKQLDWQFFGAEPESNNTKALEHHRSSPYGQFGETLFEDLCLKTKPDIVVLSRDYWMDVCFLRSVYRNNYKVIWMPTVDGMPQKAEWLDDYRRNVDLLLTYTEFGKNVLESQDPNINVFDVAKPGVDHDVFKPLDKKSLRKKYSIPEDAMIINTTMRNQKRKLFPDLIEMFSQYIKHCISIGDEHKANNTYLHLHTSYPDVGFDIARHIMQNGLGHRILVTYYCQSCKKYDIANFGGETIVCKNCFSKSCHMPNTGSGVSREQLAEIYNIADLYVQYSICLHPEEEIKLDSGWTPIKDVKIGDKALTHNGTYQRVLDTFKNQSDHLNRIEVHGDYNTMKITDNHPVYCWSKNSICPDNKLSLREYIGNSIRNNKGIPHFKFINVENLEKGDLIAQPIDDSVKDIEQIDLAEFTKEDDLILDNFIEVKHGNAYPRFIDVNEDFCQLMGLFAADGSYCTKDCNIKITCQNNETNNIELSKTIFRTIADKDCGTRFYKERNAQDLICNSRLMRDVFKTWFKKHENKQLPNWTLNLPLNKQRKIIHGMFMGDGCEHTRRGSTTSIYCTISRKLADQLKFMLERCRIPYNCRKSFPSNKDGKNRKPQYIFEIKGKLKTEFSPELGRRSSRSLYYQNYIVKNIKKIERQNYSGTVNNIEVDKNNSYVTKMCCVHNCEGFGMPIAEAKACAVPAMGVDYSATSEQVVESVGCMPLKVGKMFHESVIETEQIRALPDNNDTVNKIYNFFDKTKEERSRLGKIAREDVVNNYSYDRCASIFEKAIDSLDYDMTQESTWLNPEGNFLTMPRDIPKFNYASELIDWLFDNVLQKPDLKYSYFKNQLVKGLNTGVLRTDREKGRAFGYDQCLHMFADMVEKNNYFEKLRLSTLLNKRSEENIWSVI